MENWNAVKDGDQVLITNTETTVMLRVLESAGDHDDQVRHAEYICEILNRTGGDCVMRRPTEAAARAAIEAWLDVHAPGYPDYSLCVDGDESESTAPGKCGWAFWIASHDTTSYLHEDLSIEWYGTGWPHDYQYDEGSGYWVEVE